MKRVFLYLKFENMGVNNVLGDTIGDDGRKKIKLLDTTLRDGHQCPGAAIESDSDYFKVVRGLDQIGFDICEVGFPASSEHEKWRVNKVAQMCRDGEISTMVAGLSQMVPFQVDACLEAISPAAEVNKALFHIYFPVDPNLRQASIGDKISDSQAVEDVAKFTRIAKEMGAEVQFSPEGYSRVGNNFNFCTELLIAAAQNGASYFNMPDTIGGADPLANDEKYYVNLIMRHKAILDKMFPENTFIWSVHNHNDLGNAVENSIRALLPGTGISKVEGTINGIGERAGNADLNQVIARMKTTLGNQFNINHIDATVIAEVSELVSRLMLPVQPNYPIVGSNAMRHTSGGHANAILKNLRVYQPYNPKIVGGEVKLVYGPNSGGNLAIDIIKKQGYICPKADKRVVDEFLKARMQETGRYKGITDEQLLEMYFDFRAPVQITGYEKSKIEGSNMVGINFDGKLFGQEGISIQSETAFTALKDYISERIPGYSVKDFRSGSEQEGSRSKAITTVEIICEDTQEVTSGVGKDNDIETSSLKALANAFNQIFIDKNYRVK